MSNFQMGIGAIGRNGTIALKAVMEASKLALENVIIPILKMAALIVARAILTPKQSFVMRIHVL